MAELELGSVIENLSGALFDGVRNNELRIAIIIIW